MYYHFTRMTRWVITTKTRFVPLSLPCTMSCLSAGREAPPYGFMRHLTHYPHFNQSFIKQTKNLGRRVPSEELLYVVAVFQVMFIARWAGKRSLLCLSPTKPRMSRRSRLRKTAATQLLTLRYVKVFAKIKIPVENPLHYQSGVSLNRESFASPLAPLVVITSCAPRIMISISGFSKIFFTEPSSLCIIFFK